MHKAILHSYLVGWFLAAGAAKNESKMKQNGPRDMAKKGSKILPPGGGGVYLLAPNNLIPWNMSLAHNLRA